MDKVKIERLSEGVVVNRAWLKGQGISASLVDYYVRVGYLDRVAHGVYRRPGPALKWQHFVYSLRVLGCRVHVGGRSALEVHGLAHYLPLGPKMRVHLYCAEKLPRWLFDLQGDVGFVEHGRKLFEDAADDDGITSVVFGSWDWPIPVSSPERALLEMLADVPGKASFEMADMMMESAAGLRPDLLSVLLAKCVNRKVKRLFLWLADKHGHPWFERLRLEGVNLGKGKRVVQKGGRLVGKYLITVPRGQDDQSAEPVF